ncbi:MAG: hypothetical protein HYV17_07950 [Xanthomonadales bacterium]|nr:hypothetical protein [Xanthomonadales bacterium]
MTFIKSIVQFAARLRAAHRDRFRVFSMLLIFVFFMAIVHAMNPAKAGLMAWCIARLCFGVFFGYWADRILFPYARPHTLEGIARGAAEKRRAVIVVGCVIAAALIP